MASRGLGNRLHPTVLVRHPTGAGLLAWEPTCHQSSGDQIARRVAARLQVSAHAALHVGITQRFQSGPDEALLTLRQVVNGRRVGARLLSDLGTRSPEHGARMPTGNEVAAPTLEQPTIPGGLIAVRRTAWSLRDALGFAKARDHNSGMPKPRVFLSSTCYDLSTVRKELDQFLTKRGFEVLNSESHSFGVDPGKHSHSACISEVRQCDFLVLLIGRRRGGTYIGSTNSITNEEYREAQRLEIPCIICVDHAVNAYRVSYRKNPSGDHRDIVDDPRVFHFIDNVASGHADNWLHPFTDLDDLRTILTTQFAHYLSLFSQSRRKQHQPAVPETAVVGFPSSLPAIDDTDQDEATALRDGLFEVHKLITQILKSATNADAKGEKLKQLWVAAERGEDDEGKYLSIEVDNFKQYAWSTSRGDRVNRQFKDFHVKAYYNDDPSDFRLIMRFEDADETKPIATALQLYVRRLIELHGPDDGFALFRRADMRCFEQADEPKKAPKLRVRVRE